MSARSKKIGIIFAMAAVMLVAGYQYAKPKAQEKKKQKIELLNDALNKLREPGSYDVFTVSENVLDSMALEMGKQCVANLDKSTISALLKKQKPRPNQFRDIPQGWELDFGITKEDISTGHFLIKLYKMLQRNELMPAYKNHGGFMIAYPNPNGAYVWLTVGDLIGNEFISDTDLQNWNYLFDYVLAVRNMRNQYKDYGLTQEKIEEIRKEFDRLTNEINRTEKARWIKFIPEIFNQVK